MTWDNDMMTWDDDHVLDKAALQMHNDEAAYNTVDI